MSSAESIQKRPLPATLRKGIMYFMRRSASAEAAARQSSPLKWPAQPKPDWAGERVVRPERFELPT